MENNNLFNLEMGKYIQDSIVDIGVVKRLASRFMKVADVYMYALNAAGEVICEIPPELGEAQKLINMIGSDQLEAVYHRVADDELEVQAVEDTAIPNVKVAAVSYHMNRSPLITWIVIGVLSDIDIVKMPGSVYPEEFSLTTTESQFYETIDIVRDVTHLIVYSRYSMEDAQAETNRSRTKEAETKRSLKRVEAMSELIQLLDCNEAIEMVMNSIVRTIGEYLDISHAMICQVKRDASVMDVLAEWNNSGLVALFDKTRGVKKLSFLNPDKAMVFSADTPSFNHERAQMDEYGITALAVFPIQVGNSGNTMFACFMDHTQGKKWLTEDIKFLYDSIRVFQNILARRIQKNSLASSYASLQAVLDNVGSSIYVRDMETGAPLFTNSVLKSTFAKEIRDGSLDSLFDNAILINKESGIYEINHIERGRWYELHYTYINWVDGRRVSLCAAYDVTDKKNYQRRIEQQAYTDFLTGLYNRMCCERDLAMYVDAAGRNQSHGALLYIDLDDFKHINDGLGHQYGDVLLKSISNALQRIDGINNTCYRMGGDEFVIIIPPASFALFDEIIDNIKDVFSKPWFLKNADYYCTMSMGIVKFPDSGESVQELIKKADIAMYEAKKTGKNRVAHYSDSIETSSNERLDMEKNMRDAMAEDFKEFEVYYQPIMDLKKGGKCIGAEALVRWNSLELGFISPGDFIPLAEYLGLINPIGNYVLETACKTCKGWNDAGYDYKVNVNLSVVQLLQNDIVDTVRNTLKSTGLNPKNLTLEVTESLAINDMDRMKKILSNIKTLGVKIALDDFGTGYSSLNHIREIPFDIIKVDQSFVRDLNDDAYSRSFIKMIGELAETIGVYVCVEGIETDNQFAALNDMKVKTVQGYYFDRPMPKDNFEAKYVK